MERLNLRSEDVKSRLELEQREQMIPLREVQGWLCDIGDLKNEVDAILQEADLLLFWEAVVISGQNTTL